MKEWQLLTFSQLYVWYLLYLLYDHSCLWGSLCMGKKHFRLSASYQMSNYTSQIRNVMPLMYAIWYMVFRGKNLQRQRPDWCKIVPSSKSLSLAFFLLGSYSGHNLSYSGLWSHVSTRLLFTRTTCDGTSLINCFGADCWSNPNIVLVNGKSHTKKNCSFSVDIAAHAV